MGTMLSSYNCVIFFHEVNKMISTNYVSDFLRNGGQNTNSTTKTRQNTCTQ